MTTTVLSMSNEAVQVEVSHDATVTGMSTSTVVALFTVGGIVIFFVGLCVAVVVIYWLLTTLDSFLANRADEIRRRDGRNPYFTSHPPPPLNPPIGAVRDPDSANPEPPTSQSKRRWSFSWPQKGSFFTSTREEEQQSQVQPPQSPANRTDNSVYNTAQSQQVLLSDYESGSSTREVPETLSAGSLLSKMRRLGRGTRGNQARETNENGFAMLERGTIPYKSVYILNQNFQN
jgi:hypothetical protein